MVGGVISIGGGVLYQYVNRMCCVLHLESRGCVV